MTPSPPLLEVRNLTVRFGPEASPAVDGASFTLHSRQTLAIVGESGSGKSVTAMSILGLLAGESAASKTSDASILFRQPDGTVMDLLKCTDRQLRAVRGGKVAMIFQEPMTSLNPVLTIEDQISEALRLHRPGLDRGQRRAAAVDALRAVRIDSCEARLAQYPHELSGGLRQRVMIAMALACNPTVLIADEPTTALDVSIQAQILDLLDDLRLQRSLGVLLITHDLNVVRRRADVVCVMYRGKVVEYGRGPDLLANPIHPYTAALLTCAPGLTTRGTTLPTVATSKHPHFNATLPPLGSHITPWWPGSGSSSLIKVGADHWVCACGATPADIDPIRPDIAWCRD